MVTTWNGKSGFPEDHELFAGSVGQTGTPCGNKIAATADLVIAIGETLIHEIGHYFGLSEEEIEEIEERYWRGDEGSA